MILYAASRLLLPQQPLPSCLGSIRRTHLFAPDTERKGDWM